MLKAANEYCQVEGEKKAKGFQVAESSLIRGKVLSVGVNVSNVKKGQTVLFPAVSGKVMVDNEGGAVIFYVHEDVILAVE